MKKLLIYGCGYPSITSLIKYLNTKNNEWEITGYIDDSKYGEISAYMGYPVVGNKESIPNFVDKGYYFYNNVASSPEKMELVANILASHNAKICTLIFPEPPNLDLDTITVGEGSIISPNVTVGASVEIGRNVIIRQQALVSHNSSIGDFCFIGPDACILGGVTMGDRTFIGAKSLIRENIKIGDNCVVGMGAVVLKDVPDNTIVVGNPARPLPAKGKR